MISGDFNFVMLKGYKTIYLTYCDKSYKSELKIKIILQKIVYMKKNMGNADRIIRLLVAAVIAVLYFTKVISGTAGIILLVIAGVFILTSLVSFCPLYTLFGLNTCATKKS